MKAHSNRYRQRGMSLVELMVGVTIGLFIVAAASLLVANQLSDNRRLLLETQLQQDMRATMDIITRQIRRAGTWSENESVALLAEDGGQPGTMIRMSGAPNTNPFPIQVNALNDEITFSYWLSAQDQGPWGFRLDTGRVMTSLSRGGWQELTDPRTVKVTGLQFIETTRDSAFLPCPNLCPDGTANCWPRARVRTFRVTLQAQAVSDPRVQRSMVAEARVRNELPVFANGSTTSPCPP